jgi:hypothetical protein
MALAAYSLYATLSMLKIFSIRKNRNSQTAAGSQGFMQHVYIPLLDIERDVFQGVEFSESLQEVAHLDY